MPSPSSAANRRRATEGSSLSHTNKNVSSPPTSSPASVPLVVVGRGSISTKVDDAMEDCNNNTNNNNHHPHHHHHHPLRNSAPQLRLSATAGSIGGGPSSPTSERLRQQCCFNGWVGGEGTGSPLQTLAQHDAAREVQGLDGHGGSASRRVARQLHRTNNGSNNGSGSTSTTGRRKHKARQRSTASSSSAGSPLSPATVAALPLLPTPEESGHTPPHSPPFRISANGSLPRPGRLSAAALPQQGAALLPTRCPSPPIPARRANNNNASNNTTLGTSSPSNNAHLPAVSPTSPGSQFPRSPPTTTHNHTSYSGGMPTPPLRESAGSRSGGASGSGATRSSQWLGMSAALLVDDGVDATASIPPALLMPISESCVSSTHQRADDVEDTSSQQQQQQQPTTPPPLPATLTTTTPTAEEGGSVRRVASFKEKQRAGAFGGAKRRALNACASPLSPSSPVVAQLPHTPQPQSVDEEPPVMAHHPAPSPPSDAMPALLTSPRATRPPPADVHPNTSSAPSMTATTTGGGAHVVEAIPPMRNNNNNNDRSQQHHQASPPSQLPPTHSPRRLSHAEGALLSPNKAAVAESGPPPLRGLRQPYSRRSVAMDEDGGTAPATTTTTTTSTELPQITSPRSAITAPPPLPFSAEMQNGPGTNLSDVMELLESAAGENDGDDADAECAGEAGLSIAIPSPPRLPCPSVSLTLYQHPSSQQQQQQLLPSFSPTTTVASSAPTTLAAASLTQPGLLGPLAMVDGASESASDGDVESVLNATANHPSALFVCDADGNDPVRLMMPTPIFGTADGIPNPPPPPPQGASTASEHPASTSTLASHRGGSVLDAATSGLLRRCSTASRDGTGSAGGPLSVSASFTAKAGGTNTNSSANNTNNNNSTHREQHTTMESSLISRTMSFPLGASISAAGGERKERGKMIPSRSPATVSRLPQYPSSTSFLTEEGGATPRSADPNTPHSLAQTHAGMVVDDPLAQSHNAEMLSSTFTSFAATKESGRISTFSSLEYSMRRHHGLTRQQRRQQRRRQSVPPKTTPVAPRGGKNNKTKNNKAADDVPPLVADDDDTVRERCGSVRDANYHLMMDEEELHEAGPPNVVGTRCSAEHIFMASYELIEMLDHMVPASTANNTNTNTSNASTPVGSSPVAHSPNTNPTTAAAMMMMAHTHRHNRDGGFSLGSASTSYNVEPREEPDPFVDCKIHARLRFDAEDGVLILAPRDEVEKYLLAPRQDSESCSATSPTASSPLTAPSGDGGCGGGGGAEADGACQCSEERITKDTRGMDYSKYNAHELYACCSVCKRRPASFLCLCCFTSFCPSHVSQHYASSPNHACGLYLNILDIMTSFDRVFWCEVCQRFTWKYTEIYDPLVDQVAYTRGTYLSSAARDLHCVGYETCLINREDEPTVGLSTITARTSPTTRLPPPLGEMGECPSGDYLLHALLSPLHSGDDASPQQQQQPVKEKEEETEEEGGTTTQQPEKCIAPSQLYLTPEQLSIPPNPTTPNVFLPNNDRTIVPIGDAVNALSAISVSVQGWRSTQEDAESVFTVIIPSLHQQSLTSTQNDGLCGSPLTASPHGSPAGSPTRSIDADTIPMAVYCVFDGHGGDAVAKLAAARFEQHLHQAIQRSRPEDVRARALLCAVKSESCMGRGSKTTRASLGPCSYTTPQSSPCSSPKQLSLGLRNNGTTPPQQLSPQRMSVPDSMMEELVLPSPSMTAESLKQHVAMQEQHLQPSASSPRGAPTSPTAALRKMETTTETERQLLEHQQRLRNGGIHCIIPNTTVSSTQMEMLRTYFSSIMEDAMLSLDDELHKTEEGSRGDYSNMGCTACVVGITSNFILCANLGDSGAAFFTAQSMELMVRRHRVGDEAETARILGAGYAIERDRIEGMLAVPRALGDFDFKQCGGKSAREQAVCAVPEVSIRPVPSDGERWGVLLACDGVWDTATNHQVHYALINTENDLEVSASATAAILRAQELLRGPHGEVDGVVSGVRGEDERGSPAPSAGAPIGGGGINARQLVAAAGVLAQCVAPADNDEGIGLDNCSLILVEPHRE